MRSGVEAPASRTEGEPLNEIVVQYTPFQLLEVTDVASKKLYHVTCGFSMAHLHALASQMIDKGIGEVIFEKGFIVVVAKEIIETPTQATTAP